MMSTRCINSKMPWNQGEEKSQVGVRCDLTWSSDLIQDPSDHTLYRRAAKKGYMACELSY